MLMGKPVILTLADYYLPGYKAGGPVRTLSNMADQLGDQFQFRIVTRDRDEGDAEPYATCLPGCWQRKGKAEVIYLPPRELNPRWLRWLFDHTEHDVLYLNSFFSPVFSIAPMLLRRLGMLKGTPIILAPRGEFSPGALELKKTKKRAFLALTKPARLYRDVIWQASTELEETHIREWFGPQARVVVAPNMRTVACASGADGTLPFRRKKRGEVELVSVSRISRMKNLDGALRMLVGLQGHVHFHIYGPEEDPAYWAQCQDLITRLPDNVCVRYCGPVDPERVHSVLSQHQVLLFPTRGENFGHVVLEAFLAGCPVLTSDRTPWRGLDQRGVGWDLPLEAPDKFRHVLQKCIDMGSKEFQRLSHRAWQYGFSVANDVGVLERNRQLFELAVNQARYAA
jgi:glycosyltransferase involved in cell wall biosynthesis